MPEGDTIFRSAAMLRGWLEGRAVLAARARQPGPRIEKVVGATITAVEARGKHMLMRFSNGLALHTHMRMTGVWHRYAPGERWRRSPATARVMLEVPGSVVVCFNAPVVELMAERVVELHPALDSLGPDLLAEVFDADEALRRLRAPQRADLSIAEALLDQRALAGIGNVFKSEILFIERLDPWTEVGSVSDDQLRSVLATAERLLKGNVVGNRPRMTIGPTVLGSGGGRATPGNLYVYGRAGRPCLRCRTRIQARAQGEQARRTFWCPKCQGPAASG